MKKINNLLANLKPKEKPSTTCMKWDKNGSLSSHDHLHLMKQLCTIDPKLANSEVCKVIDLCLYT